MSEDKIYEDDMLELLTAEDYRIAIVAARFNAFIVDRLLDGAEDALKSYGATDESIDIFRTPGAFELPLIAQKLASMGDFDAIIALGCVIRGDTPHFDYVCAETARGIQEIALHFDLPVIFGVLTTDDEAQAEARVAEGNNKGEDAALAALEMLYLIEQIDAQDA